MVHELIFNLARRPMRMVIVLALLDCAAAAGADAALIERVRKEAPPAWEDLARLFLHANVKFHCSSETMRPAPEPPKIGSQYTMTFAFSGDKKRWHYFKKLADGTTYEGAAVRRNDEYAFHAQRFSDSAPFVMTELGAPTAPTIETFPRQVQCAWMMMHKELSEWLKNPRFSITDASEIPEVEIGSGNKQRAVRVEFTYDHRGEKEATVASGWVDLLPDQYWARLRYRVVHPAGRIKLDRVTYGAPTAPFPPLISHVYESYNTDGTLSQRLVTEFDRFEFGDAPDSDFTFAALGLPEVGLGAPRRHVWFWVLNVGIVLAALALFLRFRFGRKPANESQ